MATPRLRRELEQALENVRHRTEGDASSYLSDVSDEQVDALGAAICDTDGVVTTAGDCDHVFPLQSVSKAFAYAVTLQEIGLEEVLAHVGVEPSGDAFNQPSLRRDGRPFNPLINAGAILTHGLIPGGTDGAREELLLATFSALAGEELEVDEEVYAAEAERADLNLSLAHLLAAEGVLPDDPREVVRGYLRQCSINVTAPQLAVMGATLAGGGVNPRTGDRVLDEGVVTQTLSVMMTCGMYDASGQWVAEVGLPAKSGVSGALVGVVPGVMGLTAYSPRLDSQGNSVRGIQLFEELSEQWDLHLLRHREPLAGLREARGER